MNPFKVLPLILVFAHTIEAQPTLPLPLADSLWHIWQDETQEDSTRLLAIYDFAWDGYLYSQPDSAYYYSQLQYDFAYAKGLKNKMAGALNTQGVSLYLRGQYAEAIDHYNRSQEIFEETGNKEALASLTGNLGNVYYQQGNYARAIDYHTRSLKTLERINDQRGVVISLRSIGNIYFAQGEYNKASEYYNRNLKIAEEIEDKHLAAGSLGNIGNIHKLLGHNAKAINYYNRSLRIAEEIGDQQVISASLGNIGQMYEIEGDYKSAMDYSSRCLKIEEEMGDKQGMAGSLNFIGRLYFQQGNYGRALEYYKRSIELAKAVGAIIETRNASKSLWELYKKLDQYQQSLEMHELYLQMRDSILNEENEREVIRQEYRYTYEKQAVVDSIADAKENEIKNAQIAQQQAEIKAKRNQQYGLFGGLGLMFVLAGVFFIQRNRIGKEKNRSEELLLNILPAEVAEELKVKGSAEAVQIDQVTVLFTDFKGFTQMSEKVTPKELVADLHECFSAFDSICEKYGIEKIKTIGDAYMAAGGLPRPNSTHAHDVAWAALEMARVVEKGKAKKIKEGLPFFEIRIGIHTGPVVAGIVGVKKFQYDIWGDTVNTASRMESSGEPGKVNISQSTYELLKPDGQFAFESRGKIAAKGKGEIEMYFVSSLTQKG